eukprot:1162087-Pelagomonas_calceolata.AAC.8
MEQFSVSMYLVGGSLPCITSGAQLTERQRSTMCGKPSCQGPSLEKQTGCERFRGWGHSTHMKCKEGTCKHRAAKEHNHWSTMCGAF